MRFRIAYFGLGILMAAMLAGCEPSGDPSVLRERSRHVYTLTVEKSAEEVQKTLIAACFKWGWTAGAQLHQEFYEDQQSGTVIICNDQASSGMNGFIADVQGQADQMTIVTVYAYNDFYAEDSQACFEKALGVRALLGRPSQTRERRGQSSDCCTTATLLISED